MEQSKFNSYFLTTKDEQALLSDCTFVFDSSALLNFYQFSSAAVDDISKKIFDAFKGRFWIPDQVEFEYFKNRESALKKPIQEKYQPLKPQTLDKIAELLSKAESYAVSFFENVKDNTSHPHITIGLAERLKQVIDDTKLNFVAVQSEINKEIDDRIKEIGRSATDDFVLKVFQTTFKTGRRYSFSELKDIYLEGEYRYRLEVAPGYLDASGSKAKSGTAKFGDLVLWKQILEYAQGEKKAIVLIIDDIKEDWCYTQAKNKKRIERPKEDLINEMLELAGVRFWMYTLSQFLYATNQILKTTVADEVIQEVSTKAADTPYVIDQLCEGPENLSSLINEGFLYVGQFYRAGLTGELAGVSIKVKGQNRRKASGDTYDLKVDIYDVANGKPNTLLGTSVLVFESSPFDKIILMPRGIQQEADAYYAIVVSYLGAPGPGLCLGTWQGDTNNRYPYGGTLASNDGCYWEINPKSWNLHFATFVRPRS